MRGLYLVALFPVISGVGFTLIQGGFSLFPRVHSPDAMVRYAGWVHLVFLMVPLSVVVVDAQSAGAFAAMGVRWAELPMLPAAVATPLAVVGSILIGIVLYYNELLVSIAIRSFVTPAMGSSMTESIMEGGSGSLRTHAPSVAGYMTCATLIAGVEEFLWRGYLIHVLTTSFALPVASGIAVSAALFGTIHAYFGVRNVLLKALDGAAWGLLLVGTGSLLAPFISHAAFQFMVWRRLNRRGSPMLAGHAAMGPSVAVPSALSAVDRPATAPRDGAPVICVDRLRKTYGATVAVDDVSFAVPAGVIFGMVGPNGAGKTTTIECIEGQRGRDSGRVEVLGTDPFRASAAFRRQIGVQLQEASLPPRMKAWEAVDLFASFYGLRVDARAELAGVGLGEKFDCEFQKLSGGQKQRLFVALALVNHPRLVFLDELTTGLDPHARQQMWDLVRSVREAGRTVVLTTHLMTEAEQLCDTVAIFNHGRIVALDSPAGLIRSCRAEFRIQFAVGGPVDLDTLAAIPGVTSAVRSGDRITITGPETMLGMVIAVLDAERCRYRDVRTVPATLDDVFLALTGPGSEV